jgi:hypothetical protein
MITTIIKSNCNCSELTIEEFQVDNPDKVELIINYPNGEYIDELYVKPEEPIEENPV